MSLGVEYKYLAAVCDSIYNPSVTLVILGVSDIICVDPVSSDLACHLGQLALLHPEEEEPLGSYEHDRGLGSGDT